MGKPIVKTMLICDSVITEEGTKKNSLIGIFENINTKQFPCVHHSLSVYINFTDALGKYKFRLELVDISNNVAIFPGAETPELEYNDKLLSNNLVFNLQLLKFERAGKYEFRLLANGDLCGTKEFNVI